MNKGQEQLTDAFLDSKRLLGDPAVDNFIATVFHDPVQKQALQSWLKDANGNGDLYTLSQKFPGVEFIEKADQLPTWADQRQMRIGAVFFSRHSEMIMSLLGLMSLPYCYNAANGSRVLHLSGRIKTETTKRLYDTAVFVWEMMAPNAFSKEGDAFTELLKVRLRHAAARYYTLKSGNWDNSWGLPINQEDMAGTNLAFSLIVIRGLRLLGFSIKREDQQAFLHLWNVIGSLCGLTDELIPQDAAAAQQLDRTISRRQFQASDHGRELTASLLKHILFVNTAKVSANDLFGLMRYLLGPVMSDELGIDAPDLPRYKISLLRTINVLKSLLPAGDPVAAYHNAYRTFRLQDPYNQIKV